MKQFDDFPLQNHQHQSECFEVFSQTNLELMNCEKILNQSACGKRNTSKPVVSFQKSQCAGLDESQKLFAVVFTIFTSLTGIFLTFCLIQSQKLGNWTASRILPVFAEKSQETAPQETFIERIFVKILSYLKLICLVLLYVSASGIFLMSKLLLLEVPVLF